MEISPGELVDRYTIARLYVERSHAGEGERNKFWMGLSTMKHLYPSIPWDELVDLMYVTNATIWDYEAPIHEGKMDGDPVIAGILALRVRKFNVVRVKISKLIDALVGKVNNK